MRMGGWMRYSFGLLLIPGFVAGQTGNLGQREEIVPFSVEAISFQSATGTGSRLDVFVQISYEQLSFVKRSGQYEASYEVTVSLLDSTGKLVNEKLWTEEIRVASFDESVSSRSYSLTQRSFDAQPGRYVLVYALRDNESKASYRQSREITIADYAQPFTLSDIMLVSRLTVSGEKKSIVPNISRNVADAPGGFFIFFEAYNSDRSVDSIRFFADVLDQKKQRVQRDVDVQKLLPGRNSIFMKIDNSKLTLGDYAVYVRALPVATADDDGKNYAAITSRSFVVRWQGVPRGLKDLDAAIGQLQYIASDKDIEYIRSGSTPEEKQQRFLEFWKKKDPNPNTPRNEAMERYYAKVEYANKHFSHYVDGWKTDMGMVYIIFGPPSNVDRHPFDVDRKPYEIWSYYELNHQFVFMDKTGFGDYRLTTPIWEVWQRPEN
jgi:GWxTD domain-containing protein